MVAVAAARRQRQRRQNGGGNGSGSATVTVARQWRERCGGGGGGGVSAAAAVALARRYCRGGVGVRSAFYVVYPWSVRIMTGELLRCQCLMLSFFYDITTFPIRL